MNLKKRSNDMNVTEMWRIVEIDRGKVKTLFHGVQGCRTLEVGRWYLADHKMVRDGGGQTRYESGFNVLLTKEAAFAYMGRFTAPRILRAAKVKVAGTVRPKPTNLHVWLADAIKIVEVLQ